ncbi:SigE family RNA polymerase sigma factor [Streptomyces sp. NPDC088748]|uniref:SigE family RNA polymerase sigma factor n=1 Tax=Streptomyces sp. NPDC088748 TaxID=3365887 RepID=UPI00380E9140
MNSDIDDEFQVFMASRWPSLLRTAYLLTGSHHDAEDLAQIALARAYAKWNHVRHSDDMAAYVRQIMIHAHADRFRRRTVREWFTPSLPETPVADQTTHVDRRSALMDALGRLPDRQRSAVVLCYFEDMTHAQVAAALGTRTRTVSSQISRGLAKLREDGILGAASERPAPASAGLQCPVPQKGTSQ